MMMTMRPHDSFATISSSHGWSTSSILNSSSRIQTPKRNNTQQFDEGFWDCKPSITSWADEVEAEEMGLPAPQQTKAISKPQLKAVVDESGDGEEEDLSERMGRERKQSFDEGQGSHEESAEGELILFLGGILFTDLEKANKDAGKEKLKELKDLRIKCIIEMLESFGKIKLLKKRWDRRYCHVVFADSVAAKQAYESLTSAEQKQSIKAATQKKLQAAGLPTIVVPSKYYVRWSTKEELMGKKKGSADEQKGALPSLQDLAFFVESRRQVL